MNYNNMSKEKLIEILIQKDNMLEKLRAENEELNYWANIDAMTGVLNKKSGLEVLEREFELSNNSMDNLVICFIDVDGLKIVNDTFGHKEGDKLLINITKILKESIRKTDFVIRMGGDEFLVVFPQMTIKEVNNVLERVLVLLDEINNANEKYNLSISYGFYQYERETKKELTINELIKRADAEMYKMKREKRRNYTKNVEKYKC
ncbi:GGDEF domain-containing protein [Asaccharospora irregularis]|uniref:Diguanylate cyclase (GGDEF) domain-containing protein n=1 Tax=Asaccharospora irregularis DSM 2635 TaxID=1121321 RepID=A0A1M5T4G1_9FIRM|nr:GGDEF domain-containing protein [Asaccharospora irregularis]SHH45263.1 diguanylate cyclase (GGDEF) domain-containing protein [Asaccharospora irregularis DSM 2635]